MIYVIDAHSLIWFVTQDPRLGPAAAAAMRDPKAKLVVPTIVLAEIQHSHDRGRAKVPPTQVRAFIAATTNAAIHPFDVAVLDRLPARLELHDGIVIATTLVFRDGSGEPVQLVTVDRQITESGLVDVVW